MGQGAGFVGLSAGCFRSLPPHVVRLRRRVRYSLLARALQGWPLYSRPRAALRPGWTPSRVISIISPLISIIIIIRRCLL